MKKIILILVLSFFNLTFSQTTDRKLPAQITTQSYYIGSEAGCTTIWVGVFSTTEGTTTLIASGEVQIGDGCPKRSSSTNPNCKDEELNGDFIINSLDKSYKYCLIDCLKVDEVYTLFVNEKNRLLSSRK
ncbi:MAG: hypothetical protein ACOVLG_12350 [Flavobacterium sp.]